MCRYCEIASRTGDGKRSFRFDPNNRARNGYDWGPVGRPRGGMWHAMREAAIGRHRLVNLVFEGGNPVSWNGFHMPMIRGFYGY